MRISFKYTLISYHVYPDYAVLNIILQYNIIIYHYIMWAYMLSCFSHVQLLCDPVDCSPPGSSVYGISQARILEWVAISFSRGSSQPRDQTHICIGRQILYHWGTWEAPISSCMLLNHLEIIQDEFLSHATKIIWKRWNKPSHHEWKFF